jgi:hypothetical protein
MALLPGESVIKRDTKDSYTISVNGQPPAKRSGEPLEVGQSIPLQDAKRPFGLHMAAQPYLGIIFALTLLLVIVITNVPLRGWGSIFVIVVTVGLCIIISLIPGAWQTILDLFYILDIHINAAGYLLLSLVLFAMWAITVFWFDPQVYILFTPGQMKVHEQIGGGETVYDTTGMMTQHLRTDLFRHWILGLGSGDLIVRTAGAQSHEFRFANVLFVGRKLQMIEDLQRERAVVKGG